MPVDDAFLVEDRREIRRRPGTRGALLGHIGLVLPPFPPRAVAERYRIPG